MKIIEIIRESKGKLTKRQRESTNGLHIFNDGPEWTSDYSGYRLGMATAMTDGVTPPDMDKESWIGRKKTAHPYTKEDEAKLKQAYKKMGIKYSDPNNGDLDSLELPTVNTKSPVAKIKKNKYGI